MNYFLQKTKKGFTLIETMIAIFILTTVLAVSMGSIQLSLQTSNFSRDQITSFYLAEEAIEYVRAVRDTNLKTGAGWLTNINQCIGGGTTCRVDAVNGDSDTTFVNGSSGDRFMGLRPCSGSTCVLNFYQPSPTQVGLYDHANHGSPSRFSRYITITKTTSGPTAGNEIVVKATVNWTAGRFAGQTYSITEVMLNTAQ
jgi:prepilin-type N-terminal cleavage/methylation domain-containing protein